MLLSVDWDAWSGCAEYVFDAPIWGTPDREHDRVRRWQERAERRGGPGAGWDALQDDYPLYPGWEALRAYAGVPAFVTLSHAQAREWLHLYPGRDVLNVDSHHDLYSSSGDSARWRPGNWAGLALHADLIGTYTARYPEWHEGLLVTEGHDMDRTRAEVHAALPAPLHDRVRLERRPDLPPARDVEAVLLVQSPSWSSPAHDRSFLDLARTLNAAPLGTPPIDRSARP